jgi:hypothetical protein
MEEEEEEEDICTVWMDGWIKIEVQQTKETRDNHAIN